jgi:PAS domain S-box-containing protein
MDRTLRTVEELEGRLQEAQATAERLAAAQARADHFKQVLLAIRRVNQLIVEADEPQKLIELVCRSLTETLGYQTAWIALLDPSNQTVVATAASGFEAGFAVLEESLRAGHYPGCMQQALERDETVLVEDPRAHCPACPVSDQYRGRIGLSRRLSQDGRIHGVLSLSGDAAYVSSKEELALFEDLVSDLGLALHRIEAAGRHRDREQYLRAILQTTADGFWVVDSQGRIVDANAASCAMMGYCRDELIGMDVSDIDANESPEDTAAHIERVMRKGAEVFESRHRRKDGSLFPVEVSTTFLKEGGGIMVCFCRDITVRKQAEAALKESEAMWRNILVRIPQVGISLDPQGRIVFANKHFLELTGWDAEAVTGRDWFANFIPEAVRKDVRGVFDRAMHADGGLILSNHENEILTRTGELRSVAWSNVVTHDTHGAPIGVTCLGVDLTERKTAEERNQYQLGLIASLLSSIPDIVFYKDTDGVYLGCNPEFARHLGLAADEIVGKTDHDLYSQEEADAFRGNDRRMLAEGVPRHNEEWVEYPDGRRVLLDTLKAPLRATDGKTIGLVGISRDITDRKRAEEELQRTTRLLESVRQAQSLYIAQGDPHPVFEALLQGLLTMTGSEFGFLDEVLHDADGSRYKLSLALSNVAWDQDSRELYEQLRARNLEFRNLDNLAGLPARLEEPIIANDTPTDPRSGGLPDGHPAIRSFMGLPVRSGGEVIGVVGVANRTGGYDEEMARFLEPYLNACAGIIQAFRLKTSESEAVAALRESEEQVRRKLQAVLDPEGDIGELGLADLVDTDALQALMEDLHRLTGIGIGLVDRDGKVLVATGVREICAKFHGVHHQTCGFCQESGTRFSGSVEPGEFKICKCKNNLWDISTPIVIGGQLVGNLFLNQFIFEDEEPDEELFRAQARTYGFDEAAYLAALQRVPRLSKLDVERVMAFYSRFGAFVSTLSYGNLKLARTLEEYQRSQKEREKLRAQLTQAQRMESVGRLAGGVAHDFNNMLNVILGHTELLLEDLPADSALQAGLAEIWKAALHSADLTRQLLAFARKQTIAPRVLDLNETIEALLRMMRRLIGEDIDLTWKPGQDLEPLCIDPAQVHQLLANLMVNARDAIGHEHGRVTIETGMICFDEDACAEHPGLVPGDYVLLSVSDDGCGMDQETRANIFEPFYTTKKPGEGTGLGLATVYGIAKQNDGYVTVASEPDRGSTFRIYLPPYRGARLVPQPGPAAEASAVASGDETILLVEDEPAIRDMTRIMLERLGYTVLTAGSPRAAIDLAEQHHGGIQLLLTDVVMPEMNGRALADRLLEHCPGLQCLFMSGYTADVIAQHGVLDENVIFIQKPFDKETLGAKVREAMVAP